jgi:diguanylate cyclase (GGDEF)-like protein
MFLRAQRVAGVRHCRGPAQNAAGLPGCVPCGLRDVVRIPHFTGPPSPGAAPRRVGILASYASFSVAARLLQWKSASLASPGQRPGAHPTQRNLTPMPETDRLPRAPLALIVAEHEWTSRSLESVLAPNGYAVLRAYTGRSAFERVSVTNPDVIFIDQRLPDMDAVHVCRALRNEARFPKGTPIIAVSSGVPERQQRLAVLKAGAWDLIVLPTDTEGLLLQLDTWVRAKLEADHAWELSLLDQATGLYSLQGLLRRARELASEAMRYHRSLACIAIGAEQQESTSQPAGPAPVAALSQLAEIFRKTSRESDAIGRLGESDFIILAPDTGHAGAEQLARRLLRALEEELQPGEPLLRLRAGCYAVEELPRTAHVEPVELLSRATMALRRSQANGQDAVQVYA